MKWIALIYLCLLYGCSNQPNAQYHCTDSILCFPVAVIKQINTPNIKSEKCSALSGEKKKNCNAQIQSIKEHIKEATNK
jgi:hypothetical protein